MTAHRSPPPGSSRSPPRSWCSRSASASPRPRSSTDRSRRRSRSTVAIHDALTAPTVAGRHRPRALHEPPAPLRRAARGHGLAADGGRVRARSGSPSDGRFRARAAVGRGDAQIVSDGTTLTLYDASIEHGLPARAPAETSTASAATNQHAPPTLAQIDRALAELGDSLDALRRHPQPRRRPADVHGADRAEGRRRAARRRRAGVGREQRRAAARRDLRPGPVPSPCSSCARPTSRSARSPTSDIVVPPPAGTKVVDLCRPAALRAGGAACRRTRAREARHRRLRRAGRGCPSRSPPPTSSPACRASDVLARRSRRRPGALSSRTAEASAGSSSSSARRERRGSARFRRRPRLAAPAADQRRRGDRERARDGARHAC